MIDRPTLNRARGKRCDIDGQPKASEGFERVNALEKKWIDNTREKLGQPTNLQLLQKTFDRMK